MRLTAEEEAMLRGERGETVREALALQLEVAKFYGARRFVPITNVHMMGDIEVMGDGGLAHLRRLAQAVDWMRQRGGSTPCTVTGGAIEQIGGEFVQVDGHVV